MMLQKHFKLAAAAVLGVGIVSSTAALAQNRP